MAEQLDLMAVVKAKLSDVREKATQLVYAEAALKDSRYALVEAQKDLSMHIENLKSLESEITSELTSANLSEVKEGAVADSLKAAESAVDESLTETVEPAKTAASDESPVSTEDDADEDVEPAQKPVKASPSSKKIATAEKMDSEKKTPVVDDEDLIPSFAPDPKATAPVGGLWDDDDDDAVF